MTVDALTRAAEWPGLVNPDGSRWHYLDTAATAQKPQVVIDAMVRALGSNYATVHRGVYARSADMTLAFEAARRKVAGLIGGAENELVFTRGATEAINLVARGFPYDDQRREVVLTDLEHNAVFLPFHDAAERGEIELKFCRSRDGRVDLEQLRALVTEKTALVALTRASNVFGGVQPLAEACRLAHGRGAYVLSDQAQYLSSHREDVRAVNVDFAAFSAHKLGGPFGLGVLYGKENLLNRLGRYKVGGGAVKSVSWTGERPEVVYLDAPMRFEAGVANFGAAVGLIEALKLLTSLPPEALRAHVGGLARRAAAGLADIPQIKVLGDPDQIADGSLVSFYPVDGNFSITDFNLFLNHELGDHFIAVRSGEHCAHLLHQSYKLPGTVRASFFAYNTIAEVDLYVAAVNAYVKAACA